MVEAARNRPQGFVLRCNCPSGSVTDVIKRLEANSQEWLCYGSPK
jgi:hypothetical protein